MDLVTKVGDKLRRVNSGEFWGDTPKKQNCPVLTLLNQNGSLGLYYELNYSATEFLTASQATWYAQAYLKQTSNPTAETSDRLPRS